MPFTKSAIETFISSKITHLTECRVGDLAGEFPNSGTWVSGLGLVIIFNNQPPDAMRPFVLQFVRRVEMTIAEYTRMRVELQGLLSGSPQWSPYYRSLHHGEMAIALLYQAYELSYKKLGMKLFESEDGSPLDRLNKLYATSKHQVARAEDPIWLSNDGFHSLRGTLSFAEFEELARSCGRIAVQLANTKKV